MSGSSNQKVLTVPVGFLATNCYIVYDEDSKKGLVIDPGDSAGKILSVIESAGVQVEAVVLTHTHHDHIGAVSAVCERTGARLMVGKAEDVSRLEKAPDTLLSDGDSVKAAGTAFEVIHTPGHTRGSICLKVGEWLFTGDTLFYLECGRCDLEGGSFEQMCASLRRLRELSGDFTVYPGHDQSSTLSFERINNPYMSKA